jgi:hypothetical protein
VGGKLVLIPERAAVVRLIFDLCLAGYGSKVIAKKLTDEGVKPLGRVGRWRRNYVGLILADRRALGELQPRLRDGTKDGGPIPNYYPAVVTEDEWQRSRGAALQRKIRRGRVSKVPNPFAGLLRDARDGGTYFLQGRPAGVKGGMRYVLFNTGAWEGNARGHAFPYDVFERAVLSLLAEIDPHEILNGDHGPDETQARAGELARLEQKIAELEAELLKGDVAALARVLRTLEEQKRDVVARLAEARQKAANPLSEAWGECQSLIGALDAAPDPEDARVRLRTALRRIIDSVWLLVVPRPRRPRKVRRDRKLKGKTTGAYWDRLCAVQIWFADGRRHRDYLIHYRPPAARAKERGGLWQAVAFAGVAGVGDLDLRQRDHAAKLEKALLALDLDAGADPA